MNAKFAIGVLVLLFCSNNCVFSAQYFPDAVSLKSGENVEGQIIAESEQSVTISVDTPTGKTERTISKSEIAYIVRASAETPTPKPEPPRSPDPNALSPDKKWEYREPDESTPKIVKAGTNDVAGDLDACDIGTCGQTTVSWAPDSKRLSLYWGQGREHHTALYQLKDENWSALKTPGEDDEILDAAQAVEAAQLKKKGLSKKTTSLRFLWWTVRPDRWVDANNLIVFASLAEWSQSKDLGFGGSFLFTLKFDAAGNWKIVKTHRMSEKEVKQFYERE